MEATGGIDSTEGRSAVMVQSRSNHHAILIGINAYTHPYKPLKGCVNDIDNIKSILESNISLLDCQTFTATSKEVGQSGQSDQFVEGRKHLPTLENVESALQGIIGNAQNKDYVYFHYSGHGVISLPSTNAENMESNRFAGDLALALLDEKHPNKVKPLLGRTLAKYFNAMISDGLILTVVLDCCFSATVYRGDGDTSSAEVEQPDARCLTQVPQALTSRFRFRDADFLSNFMLDPTKYALLVAAGPRDIASEIRIGQDHVGKLSYYLYRVLQRKNSLGIMNGHIYRQLRALFFTESNKRESQTPCLFGDQKQAFFGPHVEYSASDQDWMSIPVVVDELGSLILLAGEVHGMHLGEEAVIDQANEPTVKQNQIKAACFRVARVDSFTSLLDAPRSWRDEAGLSHRHDREMVAMVRSSGRMGRFPIFLDPSLGDLEAWRVQLSALSLSGIASRSPSIPYFQLDVVAEEGRSSRRFRIRDALGQEYLNLPPLPEECTDIRDVVSVLHHLARYSFVKSLSSPILPDDPWRKSFTVYAKTPGARGTSHPPGEVIEVQEQTSRKQPTVELRFQNDGDSDLYVYICGLGPCWDVKLLRHATVEVLFSNTRRMSGEKGFARFMTMGLRTRVPEVVRNKGGQWCEDIVKVIVTTRWTAFDVLEQDQLWQLAEAKPAHKSRAPRPNDAGPERWTALIFGFVQGLQIAARLLQMARNSYGW